MGTLLAILGIMLFVVILLVYSTLINGFIIFKFWYWFVLPVFTTLPPITFYGALGLAFVVGLFKSHYYTPKQTIDGKKIETTQDYTALLTPWFTLLIGYLVHLFIN